MISVIFTLNGSQSKNLNLYLLDIVALLVSTVVYGHDKTIYLSGGTLEGAILGALHTFLLGNECFAENGRAFTPGIFLL